MLWIHAVATPRPETTPSPLSLPFRSPSVQHQKRNFHLTHQEPLPAGVVVTCPGSLVIPDCNDGGR